jgi:hypothetical protein
MLLIVSLVLRLGSAVSLAQDTNKFTPGSSTANGIELSNPTNNVALPSSITIDGIKYEGARWGRLTPGTITIYHTTGIATIPLADLPPGLQKQFGYDPQKAGSWLVSDQAASAASQVAVREAIKRRANEQRTEQLQAAADIAAAKAELERQSAATAVAGNRLTNQVPQSISQSGIRSAGGVTVNDVLNRIQRNYGTPPP